MIPSIWRIYSPWASTLTVKENILLRYSLPLPTLISPSTWLLLKHVGICPDTDAPHAWKFLFHSLPPPPRPCRGCWNSALSRSLSGVFLQSWELLLRVSGSWFSFNNHPFHQCLPVSPSLGWVGSHKEEKIHIFTHSLVVLIDIYQPSQDGC